MKLFGGLDPGKKGGLTVWVPELQLGRVVRVPLKPPVKRGKKLWQDYDVPALVSAVRSAFSLADLGIKPYELDITVIMEGIDTRPGLNPYGVYEQGRGYGLWEGAAAATGAAMEYVRSSKWKPAIFEYFGYAQEKQPPTSMEKNARQKIIDARRREQDKVIVFLAAQCFPNIAHEFKRSTIDDGIADGAMMMWYFIHLHGNVNAPATPKKTRSKVKSAG